MNFYQIFIILVIGCQSACAFMINVGTTLFRYPEGEECCWLPSDVALLQTRMIFENLMPEPNLLNFVHDSCITAVYDYFKLLADTVRCRKHQKTQRIFLYAISDVIGGYIRHIIFPKLKFVFYAGYIDYQPIHKFQRMYFEIKILLRTNGKTWAKPIQTRIDFASITDVLKNTKTFMNISCLLIKSNIENNDVPKVKGVDTHYRLKKDITGSKLIPVINDYQVDYSDGTIDNNYECNDEPKTSYWLTMLFRISLIVVTLLFLIVLIYFCCNQYRRKYQNLEKKNVKKDQALFSKFIKKTPESKPKESPIDMFKMKTNASSDKSSSESEDESPDQKSKK